MKGDPSAYEWRVGVSFSEDLSVEVAVAMTSEEVGLHGSKSRFTESQLKQMIGST